MDMNYTTEQLAFRDEVRRFVDSRLPHALRDKLLHPQPLDKDDHLQWQRILHAQGWGAVNWPVAFGGTGWDTVQKHIFEEVCAEAGAPPQLGFGIKMVAPVIQSFGSLAQHQRFLPGIIDGTVWWAQGYSEPGAGSDLAALKTRAERKTDADGEHYIVNGQKTWTTYAQYADWIFCLVRTAAEGRKQEGISFLLIDMNTPGITLRPIVLLDGEPEVNEVWFDNVRVPIENRVGEENKGWTYAKYLLGFEPTTMAGVATSKAALKGLKHIAAERLGDDGRPLIDDLRFRDRVAQVEMELMALEFTNLKVISASGKPGPEASILKIKGSEIGQQIAELCMAAVGHDALAADAPFPDNTLTAEYLNFRKKSIYGGSTEVQKNIISRALLGL